GKVKTAALSRSRSESDWLITAEFGDGQAGRQEKGLFLQIISKTGAEIPAVIGTQLNLAEDGEPVVNYTLDDRGVQETKSIVFVVPWTDNPNGAPWGQAIQRCLPWRRLADFWAVLCYSADAPDLNDTTRFILPPAVEDTAAL